MQKFLLLFLKRGSFLVFIILEIIAFTLIVKYNHSQREIFLNSSNLVSGAMLENYNSITQYLHLKELNNQLLEENTLLKQQQINLFRQTTIDSSIVEDSVRYQLIASEISNKSTHLFNNYLTLNKGSSDGVARTMGVIGENGIVGIVRNVSPYFSQVLSILNQQTRISTIIKNKNYLGYLRWDGLDPTKMILEAIPTYSNISIGDTIVTSGYSSIFPKGIAIGNIEKFWVDELSGNNFIIVVDLFLNMNKIEHCYIIDNKLLKQQKMVEKE